MWRRIPLEVESHYCEFMTHRRNRIMFHSHAFSFCKLTEISAERRTSLSEEIITAGEMLRQLPQSCRFNLVVRGFKELADCLRVRSLVRMVTLLENLRRFCRSDTNESRRQPFGCKRLQREAGEATV